VPPTLGAREMGSSIPSLSVRSAGRTTAVKWSQYAAYRHCAPDACRMWSVRSPGGEGILWIFTGCGCIDFLTVY